MFIRRASFDLKTRFADNTPASAKIKFDDIALMASATAVTTTKTTITQQAKTRTNAKAKAAIAGKVKKGKAASEAVGQITGNAERTTDASEKTTSSSQVNTLNVNGTATGTEIKWSIESAALGRPIIGDVFRDPKGTSMVAAVLVRNAAGKDCSFEIEGTVRALMQDIDISQVIFTNEVGEAIRPEQLDKALVGNVSTSEIAKDVVGMGGLRGRILKEIIRRHLKDFNLDVGSAHVEICKAQG